MTAPGVTLPDSPPPNGIRLEACPKCDYSLQGLPPAHRCPECGFAYDDRTFVLAGISRGAGSMGIGRKGLWGIVVFAAWLGPMLLPALLQPGRIPVMAGLAAVWLGLVVYLVLTGKRERRGIEKFLFTAGGFGYCADLIAGGVTHAEMVSWHDVDSVQIDRKGALWHRIRIGRKGPGGRFHEVRFDVGVRCDEGSAAWIHSILIERMATARQTAPNDDQPARMG